MRLSRSLRTGLAALPPTRSISLSATDHPTPREPLGQETLVSLQLDTFTQTRGISSRGLPSKPLPEATPSGTEGSRFVECSRPISHLFPRLLVSEILSSSLEL